LPEEIDLKDLQFCDACAEHLVVSSDHIGGLTSTADRGHP
jgi:hypothetical protein